MVAFLVAGAVVASDTPADPQEVVASGAVADEVPGAAWEDVAGALEAELPEHASRIPHRRRNDVAGSAPEPPVPVGEEVDAGRRVVRQDEVGADGEPGEPAGDDADRARAPVPDPVPDPDPRHQQRQVLLRRSGEREERDGAPEAILVEVPDREGEQRAGEGDRMELVQRQPLDGRVDEIREPAEHADVLCDR